MQLGRWSPVWPGRFAGDLVPARVGVMGAGGTSAESCRCGGGGFWGGPRGPGRLAPPCLGLPVAEARRRRLYLTARPAVVKTTSAPPNTIALAVRSHPNGECGAGAPAEPGLDGRCDADAVGDGAGPGSGAKRTPGPAASAGSWRIQPGSITRGFSSRSPFG